MIPQATALANLAKQTLRGKQIQIPTGWRQPTGRPGENYVKAFKREDLSVPSDPTWLFVPASSNRLHVHAAEDLSNRFTRYVDGMCGAIANAWSMWMAQCSVTGAMVAGPVGVLSPGCVVGPPLQGLLMASNPPMSTPGEARFTRAVVQALNLAWQAWHLGLSGSLNYPPAAFFPAPVVPGLPNISSPVAGYGSSGDAMMTRKQLASAMERFYGGGGLHASPLFDALSDAVATTFITWKAQTQLTNVVLLGPVPTYAPPLVPAGPVLGGVASGSAVFV